MTRRSAIKERFISFLLLFAVMLPIIILAGIIIHNWVNIPHMDQWGISRVFDSYFDRGLPVKDLIAQHNESRKAVPRLIILGLGLISGWDVRWEIGFTFLLACLLSVTFYHHLRRLSALTTNQALAVLALLNLFLFSPAQYGNWFMGLQLCVFIPPLMLSLGILSNTSRFPEWTKMLIAILCALAATFSFANGMILWLLLVPPGVFSTHQRPRDKKKICAIAVYVVCFILTLLLYFRDYERPAQSYPMGEALLLPTRVFRFFLLWLSTPIPVSEHIIPRSIIGGTIVILFAYLSVTSLYHAHRSHAIYYPWIVFGLYSMISDLAASMGRLGFGYDMALSSRYATPAVFMTIGVLSLTVHRLRDQSLVRNRGKRWSHWLKGVILVFFIALHIHSFLPAVHSINQLKRRLVKGKTALRLIHVLPHNEKLSCIHTNHQFLEHRFSRIQDYDLLDFTPVNAGTFDFNTQSFSENDVCIGSFDRIKSISRDRIRVEGWVGLVSDRLENQAIIFVGTDSRHVSTPMDFVTLCTSTPLGNQPYVSSRRDVRRFTGIISLSPSLDVQTISAWIIDFNSQSMFRLAGIHSLQIRPGRSKSPGAAPPAVGGDGDQKWRNRSTFRKSP